MEPKDVIAGLRSDPEALLRHCYLAIGGGVGHEGSNGTAVVRTFEVTMSDKTMRGFTTGLSGFLGRKKDRPQARIDRLPGPARATRTLRENQLNAYYIPMVQVVDVGAGSSHYTLPTNADGPSLALTSQISGCVFSLGSDADGAVLASHVQPRRTNPTPEARQPEAVNAGRIGFAHGQQMWQVNQGNQYMQGDRVAIVGRRSQARWSFYMQRMTGGTWSGSIHSAAKIVELG